jgi:hypothetical protein
MSVDNSKVALPSHVRGNFITLRGDFWRGMAQHTLRHLWFDYAMTPDGPPKNLDPCPQDTAPSFAGPPTYTIRLDQGKPSEVLGSGCRHWLGLLKGSSAAEVLFHKLAETAGRLVLENSVAWPVPPEAETDRNWFGNTNEVTQLLPRHRKDHSTRWVCCLHWLGWVRPAGSTVEAKRGVFLPSNASCQYSYDAKERAELMKLDPMFKEKLSNLGTPPDSVSELKDVFSASVSAIDWLLAPPVTPLPPDPLDRMRVRRNPPSITLDGNVYGVSDEQAIFVDVLSRNLGNWVAPSTFENEPGLGVRRDRIKRRLPMEIRKLIEGKPGGGYKMTLA